MDKQLFWGLIDSVNRKVDVDDKEAVLAETRRQLCGLRANEIVEWHEIYSELHKAAYRDDLWDEVEACGIHATDDGFIDFRAWLVSRGQEVFEAVMDDPKVLADYVSKPREANFELYGYVSSDAYAEKACREALGDEGFEAYKREWIEEHMEAIRENADWNGSTIEVAGERLFHNALLMKHNVYKVLDGVTLDSKLEEAHERSEDAAGCTDKSNKKKDNIEK